MQDLEEGVRELFLDAQTYTVEATYSSFHAHHAALSEMRKEKDTGYRARRSKDEAWRERRRESNLRYYHAKGKAKRASCTK